jgi:hypothetical protein
MKRIRIYTENKNTLSMTAIIQESMLNYTMYSAVGYFNGQIEKSVVFEFITEEKFEQTIYRLARAFKRFNKQTMVLVTKEPIEQEII